LGLESVEIVLALEEIFQIRFPDRIARPARTVSDLEEMVLQLRKEQLSATVCASVDEGEIRTLVREIIAKELAIDSKIVTPSSSLVGDLGMDA
jgi:acyl carrier protein